MHSNGQVIGDSINNIDLLQSTGVIVIGILIDSTRQMNQITNQNHISKDQITLKTQRVANEMLINLSYLR